MLALDVSDDVFTILFTVEMLIKILALGVLIPAPTAYLRDPWNVFDGSVVVWPSGFAPNASPSCRLPSRPVGISVFPYCRDPLGKRWGERIPIFP